MSRLEQFAVDGSSQPIDSVLRSLEEEALRGGTPVDSAEILMHLGEAYRRIGRFNRALRTYSKGFQLWAKLGRGNRMCWCLWGIGTTLRVSGRFRECPGWLRAAANVAASSAERRCYLWSHAEITETLRIIGLRRQSLPDHLALLEQFHQIHDSKGICWGTLGLGQIYRMERHYKEASTWFQKGLIEAEHSRDLVNAGYALRGLAEIAKESGDHGMAGHLAQLSLENFKRKGYPTGEAYAAKTLADIKAKAGLFDDALALATSALVQFKKIGKLRGIAYALRSYAEIQALVGSAREAWIASHQAAAMFNSIGVHNLSIFDPNLLAERAGIEPGFKAPDACIVPTSLCHEQTFSAETSKIAP
jgi:tetratricopeptide (TPR) repeat protein